MFANLMIGLLLIALLLVGTLYEFGGAIMLVIASATLIFFVAKKRRVKASLNAGSILAILFTILYFVSSIYALDSGMAFLGGIKILWVIPAVMCYSCLDADEREKVFDFLPWFGNFTTVIGIATYFIAPLKEFFYASNRFGGFFFYANTQAIFLLMCIIWMCNRRDLRVVDYVRYVLMLVGIALTGSRTAMVLSVIMVVYLMIRNRNLKFILITLGALALGVGAILLEDDGSGIARLADLSVTDSTFVGRLLYVHDALPLIASHPFGMGHLGYYYIQDSIQSGIYSVTYVHNDVVQLGLDIGIIPMVLYVVVVGYSLLSKWLCPKKKIMLLALFLHGLMDYDLSFTSMLLILLMILWEVKGPWEKKVGLSQTANDKSMSRLAEKKVANLSIILGLVSLVFIGVGAYFSIALTAEHFGDPALAYSMYEPHTQAKLALLSETEDAREADMLAESILKQNSTCSLAYYKKAVIADYAGDYDEMIRYGKLAIENNFFRQIEYERYAKLLYDGLMTCQSEVYEKCASELKQIEHYMEIAMNRLSYYGERINEQPNLHVTTDMQEILDEIDNR